MKVLMVCTGNICRSPTAEGVLRYMAQAAGLPIEVDSAGTHDYRVSFTAAGRYLTGGANRAATDWNINGIVVP